MCRGGATGEGGIYIPQGRDWVVGKRGGGVNEKEREGGGESWWEERKKK